MNGGDQTSIAIGYRTSAAIAVDNTSQLTRPVQGSIPAGWRNNPTGPQRFDLLLDGKPILVEMTRAGQSFSVDVDGEQVDITVHQATSSTIDATSAGIRRRFRVELLGDQVAVDSGLGASTFDIADRFPSGREITASGGLAAPMPGLVVRVLVEVGQEVEAGDPLLVLEAMKMEHTISSPTKGAVTAINVALGEQVERGVVLAEVSETHE